MTTRSRIQKWDAISIDCLRDSLLRSGNEVYYTERMHKIEADGTPETQCELAQKRMGAAQAARGYGEKVTCAKYLLDQLEDLMDQIAGVDLSYHPIKD